MRGGGSPQGCAPHITDSQAVRGESAYEILKICRGEGGGRSIRSVLLSSSERDTRARAVHVKMGLIVYSVWLHELPLSPDLVWAEVSEEYSPLCYFYCYTTVTLLCRVAGWGQALSPCALQLH